MRPANNSLDSPKNGDRRTGGAAAKPRDNLDAGTGNWM